MKQILTTAALVLLAMLPAHAADEVKDKSSLSVAWSLLDGGGKAAAKLEPGGAYELTVTLTPQAQAKINPLVQSHQVRLSVGGRRNRSVKVSGGKVDAKTGRAVLTLRVAEAAKKLPDALTLEASVVLCDDGQQWCAAVRETATLTLPSGKSAMSAQPLRFNAGDKQRVVLKVGDKAPDFTAPNQHDKRVSLSDYRDKKWVILLFSRAHW